MHLTEAMKIALHYRQCPMTAPQIAYFLCTNNIVQANNLPELAQQVEEEAFHNPAHFAFFGEFIHISVWHENERQMVQHVFDVVQKARTLYAEVSPDNAANHTLILALLLYKRLSDIRRSQQHGSPIVPGQLKFNNILTSTLPAELPVRLQEVMEYIERTDSSLAGAFLSGKEALGMIRSELQVTSLQEVMLLLSELHLDEEQVPTPLFQTIFSRLFWNSLMHTCRELSRG